MTKLKVFLQIFILWALFASLAIYWFDWKLALIIYIGLFVSFLESKIVTRYYSQQAASKVMDYVYSQNEEDEE